MSNVLVTRPKHDYTVRYISAWNEEIIDNPIAKFFSEPSNLVATTLLKGYCAGEAYKRSQKAFRRNINRLISSETNSEESATIKYLLWDMQHQVCLGDKDAKAV